LEEHKDKQALTQYIATNEVDDGEGENAKTSPNTSTSRQCLSGPSVFSRLGKGKIPKPSIFRRLKKGE